MARINIQDIYFLIALNASEESTLMETMGDIERWDCEKSEVLNVLASLIQDDTILLTRPIRAGFEDISKAEAIALAASLEEIQTDKAVLSLTERGVNRWKEDDWGITNERAKYLMFSNQLPGRRNA